MVAQPHVQDHPRALAADPVILRSKETFQFDPLPPDLDTLPKHFLARVKEYGDQIAMSKKRYGIWQEYTWNDCYDYVNRFCLAMVDIGLKRGDKVAIIGENDPQFYWAEIAIWAAGGTTTAIFTDANLQELAYIVDNSDSVYLIAHDQEQCDKALAIRDKIPNVRKVIYWDDNGMWNYPTDWLACFDIMVDEIKPYADAHPGLMESMISEGHGEDIVLFSYTSGTTSLPKGAMIRHRNLIYGNRHVINLAPTYPTDNYVSFSPPAWITEQSLGVAGHLITGVVVNFPENASTIQNDIREVAPSSLLFPSRIWEGLASTTQMRINDSTWFNRVLFKAFLPVAYQVINHQDNNTHIPRHIRALHHIGESVVFKPLRNMIGMTKVRNAFTSGSTLTPDQLRFFRAIGVELKNLYGSTECQSHTLHYAGNIKLETVGPPAPGVEVRIAENGELWIRSRAVFAGYYKDEEKTAQALDADGWFHTGDAGYADADGHLIYLDRVSDMIQLANGEAFSPQYIEGRLKFSPYIQDVMVVGGSDTHFVAAIINMDFDNVARWAEKRRISFTTFADLSQRDEIYDLIKAEIHRVNQTLPPAARLKKFVVLHKAFDADENELTRTRKLRRRTLEQKYASLIHAMYHEIPEVIVCAEVKYRDGRTGILETPVRVCSVDAE